MMKNSAFKGLFVLAFIFAVQSSLEAAPPCKGPNKNDAGCEAPIEEPVADPVMVDSVTVDWLNERLVVRGSGFTGSTSFLLGSNVTPLATAAVTATELDIPFSTVMANEVTSQGNYKLDVDGTVQLSIFIESNIPDPAVTACPCTGDWATELGALWDPVTRVTACYEISDVGAADISGTVLSNPPGLDYPQYPIGASWYGSDPDSSVCRLVRVNGDATAVDLVNIRINSAQQADCANELTTKICDSVTTLP
jgi:hypothetical protein